MLGQQFYHETIRKMVVSFGTIFNNIQIVKKNSSGQITQSMKVPLAYGPKQKFLTRIREDASLNNQLQLLYLDLLLKYHLSHMTQPEN